MEAMDQKQLELAALIEKHGGRDGIHPTPIPGLTLIRSSTPTMPTPVLYRPALCIIAQGQKQVLLADRVYTYGPQQYLVVSVDLPLAGQVTEATPSAPYLCLQVDLDPVQLGELMLEAKLPPPSTVPSGPGLSVSPLEPALFDAAFRLVHLLETPHDVAIMAPLIMREVLYRLLSSEHNAQLRQIAFNDNRIHAVNQAISWLKHNYSRPFRIETLAREAHMSPSALHHHFKTVTAMSPLQYQKQLRLQEARRLMLSQTMDAATAGQNVGYESSSQFSREYSRLFGAPPSRDIASLKSAAML